MAKPRDVDDLRVANRPIDHSHADRVSDLFPAASYQYVFHGMGQPVGHDARARRSLLKAKAAAATNDAIERQTAKNVTTRYANEPRTARENCRFWPTRDINNSRRIDWTIISYSIQPNTPVFESKIKGLSLNWTEGYLHLRSLASSARWPASIRLCCERWETGQFLCAVTAGTIASAPI